MKKLSKEVIFILILSLFVTLLPINTFASDTGTTYYVDSVNRNDLNDGLDLSVPGKHSPVHQQMFILRETVFSLKKGSYFFDRFTPRGSALQKAGAVCLKSVSNSTTTQL